MQVYIWNIVGFWALTIGYVRLIHNAGKSIADFRSTTGNIPVNTDRFWSSNSRDRRGSVAEQAAEEKANF